jgi:AbrB family looped-hinge helix DNA binding protein
MEGKDPMATAKVTSKGQITIPVKVRTALRLEPGDKIDFIEIEKGRFALRPRNTSLQDLEGCVPKLDHVPTIEQINEGIADAAAESYLRSIGKSLPGASDDEAA